jgi:hypothetical protein
MQQLRYLLTSGASNPTQLAPFPECLSPGVSPGVYKARLTAKTLRVLAALDASRSFLAGVSTGGIR